MMKGSTIRARELCGSGKAKNYLSAVAGYAGFASYAGRSWGSASLDPRFYADAALRGPKANFSLT